MKYLAFATLVLLGAGAVYNPSAAQSVPMTPALKELAAAADKEGEVIIRHSANFFDGGRGIKLYTDDLNKAYGTHIKITWSPGGSMPDIGNEIAVSVKNGLPAPTDMYTGFSRNMAALLEFDLFEKAPWSSYDPDRLNDHIVERGTFVKSYSTTLGFSYNTDLVKSNPERIMDFMKPEFKGKIATTSFGAGYEQLASKEAWGPEKTIQYAKDFSQQVAGFMLCPEAERLASGEFSAFVTDCGGGSMVKAAMKGAPIKRLVAPDYPLIGYFYVAVPKNAKHPNAGKLFVTFLNSVQGQKDMFELGQIDLHLYPGSQLKPMIDETEKKFGFKFGDADIAWQETNDAGNAAQREVVKILQESGK